MMTKTITPGQARALAALAVAMRTEGDPWDAQGAYTAIAKAAVRGTALDVITATLAAAMTPTNRTPAVIPMDGPHWHSAVVPTRNEHRFARCPEPGHSSYPAHNCGACRADAAETTTEAVRETQAPTPEQLDVNARGARLARAALTRTTTKGTDR